MLIKHDETMLLTGDTNAEEMAALHLAQKLAQYLSHGVAPRVRMLFGRAGPKALEQIIRARRARHDGVFCSTRSIKDDALRALGSDIEPDRETRLFHG